jgi:ParB family chromosome partitioning protein
MKKALGKGLSALIPDTYVKELKPIPSEAKTPAAVSRAQGSSFQMIPITAIRPNHDQPRREFSQESIEELTASIREKGILQPVIVSQVVPNQYELVCGERRLRAAQASGLTEVPAVVKEIAQHDFLEWALIENIQRQDLTPLEEAEAYRRLAEERMLSQEEIAKRVGKGRATVTNTLRLLRLPDEVRQCIQDGFLTAGHARALLGLLTPEHQRQLARRIKEDNLSVRQVELIVNRSNAHKRRAKRARQLSADILDLERRLAQHFATQVKIYPRKNQAQGRIEIHYFSLSDFDRILERTGLPAETA